MRSQTCMDEEASMTHCRSASARDTPRNTGMISPPVRALSSAVAASSRVLRRGGAAVR